MINLAEVRYDPANAAIWLPKFVEEYKATLDEIGRLQSRIQELEGWLVEERMDGLQVPGYTRRREVAIDQLRTEGKIGGGERGGLISMIDPSPNQEMQSKILDGLDLCHEEIKRRIAEPEYDCPHGIKCQYIPKMLTAGQREALRPEVLIFAEEMEKKLQENDHKGGWEKMPSSWLRDRMQEEMVEVDNAIDAYIIAIDPIESTHEQLELFRKAILAECADVANFAMMVASVCKAIDVRR